jgi:hypothetical protein
VLLASTSGTEGSIGSRRERSARQCHAQGEARQDPPGDFHDELLTGNRAGRQPQGVTLGNRKGLEGVSDLAFRGADDHAYDDPRPSPWQGHGVRQWRLRGPLNWLASGVSF